MIWEYVIYQFIGLLSMFVKNPTSKTRYLALLEHARDLLIELCGLPTWATGTPPAEGKGATLKN
jgi:hypothetical protein